MPLLLSSAHKRAAIAFRTAQELAVTHILVHDQPSFVGFTVQPFQSRDRQGAGPAPQLCARLTRSTHKMTHDAALVQLPEWATRMAEGQGSLSPSCETPVPEGLDENSPAIYRWVNKF